MTPAGYEEPRAWLTAMNWADFQCCLSATLTTVLQGRAVDPHSFYADPDPAVFLNADPDPDPDTGPGPA